MFTKEFIKISQILDNHGMHRQADDLLRIAQQKKPTAPAKPAPPTARPVQFMTPSEQNKRLKYFQDRINEIKQFDTKATIDNLKNTIDLQYKNNYLDYATYNKIITELKTKSATVKNFDAQSIVPINPMNPTAFPVNVNETPMRGSGLEDADGNLIMGDDGTPKTLQINLATPAEGITAAGEKAFPNREDRNLPGLVKEWNDYFKTDSFKDSIQSRIDWLKKNEPGADTTQLEELLKKANSKEKLEVGDFGNKKDNMTEGTQIYGVEAKPLTSITGTPTTPAPGTPTPPTPPTPPAPPTGSAAKNPTSR